MSILSRKPENKQSASKKALFAALGSDIEDRPAGTVKVTGKLPPGLNGVLYRNGPGLFRRGGMSKRNVLDGDGLVQRLTFTDGRADYARRFVRTPKFAAEAAANRFLYPTWATTAPEPLADVDQHVQSQAGYHGLRHPRHAPRVGRGGPRISD